MDIHNTESTNLLLANNEIVFYFTYKDFMDNYPNHLKKWLELQSPYGEEKDFKKEYLEIYLDFCRNYFGEYRFEGVNILREDTFGGSYKVFEDVSIYKDYLKKETLQLINAGKDPKKIFGKDYQKGITEEYTTDLGTHFFTYSTRQVLNMFFEWNDLHNRIIFKEPQYRNFTKNIKKIVTFLLSDESYTNNNPLSESNASKKETLPLPVSEPKPQRTEPTQDPQPVPNFGESQPAPIVSEEPQSEELQEAKNVLINGRKPNLLERYQIADRIFNIDKIITRLNVRAEDKYKILAVLLDCNEHNAKKLINRKYPAKTDQKAIKDFINKYLPE